VVFLFCGQMIARKGVDILLAAFQRLARSARLLLVGREAELPALLAALPADARSRITYAGFQAPEDLPRFFSQADVFILPSRYDGWGVVVNQALGAGLPVICSDMVGAGHDLVEDGVNGLKFPAGDSTALAQQMERLVSAPELLEEWGAASREKSRDWTPEVGAGKWVEALQAVLQQ
jgi:glycosyltransferase involved in cell wall biosynthesis